MLSIEAAGIDWRIRARLPFAIMVGFPSIRTFTLDDPRRLTFPLPSIWRVGMFWSRSAAFPPLLTRLWFTENTFLPSTFWNACFLPVTTTSFRILFFDAVISSVPRYNSQDAGLITIFPLIILLYLTKLIRRANAPA